MVFNEQNFTELCRQVRTNAATVDMTSLLRSLLIEIRRTLGDTNPDASYANPTGPDINAYMQEIDRAVTAHMNPPFRFVGIINEELLKDQNDLS
jgi:hypothetical protein